MIVVRNMEYVINKPLTNLVKPDVMYPHIVWRQHSACKTIRALAAIFPKKTAPHQAWGDYM